jgi:hypothetical protein
MPNARKQLALQAMGLPVLAKRNWITSLVWHASPLARHLGCLIHLNRKLFLML